MPLTAGGCCHGSVIPACLTCANAAACEHPRLRPPPESCFCLIKFRISGPDLAASIPREMTAHLDARTTAGYVACQGPGCRASGAATRLQSLCSSVTLVAPNPWVTWAPVPQYPAKRASAANPERAAPVAAVSSRCVAVSTSPACSRHGPRQRAPARYPLSRAPACSPEPVTCSARWMSRHSASSQRWSLPVRPDGVALIWKISRFLLLSRK
jgi:hypothetical protein